MTGGFLPTERHGEKMNALMHITDWYPTLCAWAGIDPTDPDMLDGFDQSDNVLYGETDIYSPREEILHNVDPVSCKTELCGSIRWRGWKLVVGKELTDNLYPQRTLWKYPHGVNPDASTVQCDTVDPNSAYPDFRLNDFLKHSCPYNGGHCLYKIETDPCEWWDLSSKHVEVVDILWGKV